MRLYNDLIVSFSLCKYTLWLCNEIKFLRIYSTENNTLTKQDTTPFIYPYFCIPTYLHMHTYNCFCIYVKQELIFMFPIQMYHYSIHSTIPFWLNCSFCLQYHEIWFTQSSKISFIYDSELKIKLSKTN